MDPQTSAAWVSSIAAVLTLLVAVVALVYAAKQVKIAREQASGSAADAVETRKLQRELLIEQAQPYVVVTMELSQAGGGEFIDLVVKNYGTTAAHDVKLSIDPHPERAAHADNELQRVKIPETIHILAPGQEWRTFWDSVRDRHDSDLPTEHTATITYLGINQQRIKSTTVLSWKFFEARLWFELRGMHDLAEAARRIDKKLGKIVRHGALSVHTYDGHFEADRRASTIEVKARRWIARQAARLSR